MSSNRVDPASGLRRKCMQATHIDHPEAAALLMYFPPPSPPFPSLLLPSLERSRGFGVELGGPAETGLLLRISPEQPDSRFVLPYLFRSFLRQNFLHQLRVISLPLTFLATTISCCLLKFHALSMRLPFVGWPLLAVDCGNTVGMLIYSVDADLRHG